MDNNISKRNKRLAFIFSGITDAVIGAILLGGIMFMLGAGVAIYHFSRLEE